MHVSALHGNLQEYSLCWWTSLKLQDTYVRRSADLLQNKLCAAVLQITAFIQTVC